MQMPAWMKVRKAERRGGELVLTVEISVTGFLKESILKGAGEGASRGILRDAKVKGNRGGK